MRNIECTNETKICHLWNQIVVFQIEKKKKKKFPKFYNFENHRIFIIDNLKKNQISEIVEFQKLTNF